MWSKQAWVGGVAALLVSCSVEAPGTVEAQLSRLSALASAGVTTIERAMQNAQHAAGESGEATSGLIGEGLRGVDAATRALSRLEDEPRATDDQRLTAIVLQARAWDDAARAIARSWRDVSDLSDDQLALTAALLEEKAFPARVAARNSYERALRTACVTGLRSHPAWPEIVDGVLRHDTTFAGDPCGER